MPAALGSVEVPQRLVMEGVSWDYYERTLEEIGNQHIRVSYLDGVMELMSPLPEHEGFKDAIVQLIFALTDARDIDRKSYGSSTFRREEKAVGSEPDGCFYFYEVDSVSAMKRFDPLLHRAPDLWIEVDLSGSSAHRETICDRLKVPEIWRYADGQLLVRLRSEEGGYVDSPTSRVFPFLPMGEFSRFIPKLAEQNETRVMREFRHWMKNLPQ